MQLPFLQLPNEVGERGGGREERREGLSLDEDVTESWWDGKRSVHYGDSFKWVFNNFRQIYVN